MPSWLRKILTISYQLSTISLIALSITSCSGGKMESSDVKFPSIKDVSAERWQALSQKKIFFGHQSVGSNIIDGIRDVMKESPQIRLNIVQIAGNNSFTTPVFAHAAIGKNENPVSKCEHFSELIKNGVGQHAEIAFFKFCFVDITPQTDVSKLFAEYKMTMASLRKLYPNTTFAHITVPLTATQSGPKALIKKIVGKPIGGYDDNVKREEFNAMLRNEYQGKEPLLDLAMMESTLPNGSRTVFERNSKSYPRLVPEYTNDGGHLNELGRKHVAEQFLIFLTKL